MPSKPIWQWSAVETAAAIRGGDITAQEAVEAAIARKPAVVGDYPVAAELRALGLEWLPADDLTPVRTWLADPDPDLLDRNRAVAARELSLERMAGRLQALLEAAGWLP